MTNEVTSWRRPQPEDFRDWNARASLEWFICKWNIELMRPPPDEGERKIIEENIQRARVRIAELLLSR
jgi:hypothetical protein